MQRKGQSILLSLRKAHLFFKSRDSVIFICENILFLRDFTTVYIIRILISLQVDIITVASLGTSDQCRQGGRRLRKPRSNRGDSAVGEVEVHHHFH